MIHSLQAIVDAAHTQFQHKSYGTVAPVDDDLLDDARWELWATACEHSADCVDFPKWRRMVGAMWVRVNGVGMVKIVPRRHC